ncbi:MAG: hypothetical protein PF542_06210, partial [Nanoarchaeota archaeon]|nr:hypothetical protein [Nanoarchaeota archaeon]
MNRQPSTVNRQRLAVLLFLCMFLIGLVAASGEYVYSNPKMIGNSKYFSSFGDQFGQMGSAPGFFDNSMCEEGQDFIVQIDPLGCSPAVVRSDLLEEEEVPVFCPLQAIKVNPLINIESIDSINFNGDYPPEVRTIGFHPAYAALGGNRKLNNFMWDNIGYATIILRPNENESSMPDFVEGNLTAVISYDLEGGFGLRTHNFYLPVMDDDEFNQKMGNYAFFNKMGYLRADDITKDAASISIYSGNLQNPYREGSNARQVMQSYDLKVGGTSPKILLPDLDCFSTVELKLEKIDYADIAARLTVNSEYVEVREREKFLDGLCTILELDKKGIYQYTKISCQTDEGRETLDLRVSPRITFNVNAEEKVVSLGDKIGKTEGKDLFLAYADNSNGNLSVLLVALPKDKAGEKLTDSQLETAAFLGDKATSSKSILQELVDSVSVGSVEFYTWLQGGKNHVLISKSDGTVELQGVPVSLIGLGEEENSDLGKEAKANYTSALEDYNRIISNYGGEKYPDNNSVSLAEQAISAKINLAKKMGQPEDVKTFCNEMLESYPESRIKNLACNDSLYFANAGISSGTILVDGAHKEIDFDGVSKPKFEDYGAEIYVKNTVSGASQAFQLRKDGRVDLSSLGGDKGEYFTLDEVKEKSVVISMNLAKKTTAEKLQNIYKSSERLIEDTPVPFGGRFEIVLQKAYLSRVAKVKIEPSINYQRSEATFQFKIGIEKRLIQLSPKKARSRADKINETMKDIQKISDGLGKVVSGMKKACVATGAFLTAKNVIFGASGETLARKEVMGGWEKKCDKLISDGEYRSLDACYFDHSDEIDTQVEEVAKVMNEQSDELKKLEDGNIIKEGGLLSQDVVNRTALTADYSPTVLSSLRSLASEFTGGIMKSMVKDGESIDLNDIISVIENAENIEQVYELEDLRSIELYSNLYFSASGETKEAYYKKLYSAIEQVKVNREQVLEYEKVKKESKTIEGERSLQIAIAKDAVIGEYDGDKSGKNGIGSIPADQPIQRVRIDGIKYEVLLHQAGSGKYDVWSVFDLSGNNLGQAGVKNVTDKFSWFVRYDKTVYQNSIEKNNFETSGFVVKYYEVEPYKGLPAIVPFDSRNGWYARLKPTLPSFGATRSYDESGKLQSFELCNVMDNKKIDIGTGEDKCQLINLAVSKYNDFPGLDGPETQKLIRRAVNAIAVAGQMTDRRGFVLIPEADGAASVKFPIGSPATNTAKVSCSDFMSPKECK